MIFVASRNINVVEPEILLYALVSPARMTITLVLPDERAINLPKGSCGMEIASSIGAKLAKDALAILVDGEIYDLHRPIDKDARIKILTFKDPEGKHAFWHSTAHVFAHAVKNLYPDALPTIGPAIDQGFYYDFDNLDISQDDFQKIEEEMHNLINANLPFERLDWTIDDVKRLKNPYKEELAKDALERGETLTAYQDGEFADLCAGPHLPSTKYIRAVKLLKMSAAYWKGDAKNKQLTRIYGISFPSSKELHAYLQQREEAEKRDHAKLGKKLDLFVNSEIIGKGLPLLAPKGATLKRILRRFIEDEELKRGYQYTETPVIAKTTLYELSGHLKHYKEDMFIFESGDEEFALRPMTCPHQYMIYKRKTHSYRDLPVRLAEISNLFRNEQSGELHGLVRIRQFTLADAHIICTPAQLKGEFRNVIELIQHVMQCLDFTDYWYRFSKWDPHRKGKYIDDPKAWESTQSLMRDIILEMGLDYVEAEDEAAFYGPKLDIQMRNVHGKEDTVFTVQIDFAAAEKFDLTYVNEKNEEVRPMIIHRSSIGCLERTMAMLIEKHAGKFPLWLSPEQVRVLPVSDQFHEQAMQFLQQLKDAGIRATIDTAAETISKKVRNAQLDYVNYILVFGDKETKTGELQVRTRDNDVRGPIRTDDFISDLQKEIEEKGGNQ